MHTSWRSIGFPVVALALVFTGWLAPAPSARAADTATITGTVLDATGAPCANGWVYLYRWVADPYLTDGGAWQGRETGPIGAAGAFSLEATDSSGSTAALEAQCDGYEFSRWYGGGVGGPGAPTAANSRVLTAGANDLGSLTVPAQTTISATIRQADGSVLPVYDKDGVLLTADESVRLEKGSYWLKAGLGFTDPGVAASSWTKIVECEANKIGKVGGTATNCTVPVGTFDLSVLSASVDTRADQTYYYPLTSSRIPGYAIPAAGLSDLRFTTALGPAALVRRIPTIGGTVKVGSTVSAAPGTWSERGYSTAELVFSYTWLANGRQVGTGATHRIAAAEVNMSLVLKVTASRPLYRTATAESAAALVALPDDLRLAPTMSAKFPGLKHGKSARVTVTVRASGMGALGRIVVAEGSKVLGSKTLVLKSKGVVKVKFKAPKTKGSHTVTVTYRGNAQVKGKVVTKVVKVR